MTYQTKQSIRFFAEIMGVLAFFLFVFNSPVLIQTEFWIDQCGFGFLNSTFGGYYFETGCK